MRDAHRLRLSSLLLAIALLVGCPGENAGPPDIEFCEGTTTQRYDPLRATELELWPDARLQVPDPARPSGQHLHRAPPTRGRTVRCFEL